MNFGKKILMSLLELNMVRRKYNISTVSKSIQFCEPRDCSLLSAKISNKYLSLE